MVAKWHIVKYMADPTRREPRNVGIILDIDGLIMTKFLGETSLGHVDRRLIRPVALDADVYSSWISYYRRKAESGQWSDVERLQSRGRTGNFYAEFGGIEATTQESADQILADLFERLVLVSRPQAHIEVSSADLNIAVYDIFERAHIRPIIGIEVDGQYSKNGRLAKVKFELGYQNGTLHLMEPIKITSSVRNTLIRTRDLRLRMEAARRAGSATSFLVFYSESEVRRGGKVEDILLPLEGEAQTVDVDDRNGATETISRLMGDVA